MATTEAFIGQAVLRKEDPDLLTGEATFVDNMTMAGMAWMAHGSSAVRARHGELDRHLGRGGDARRDRRLHRGGPAAGRAAVRLARSPRTSRSRTTIRSPTDKIRFNGDAVAVVVAETREQAQGRRRGRHVDATELPAVTDVEAAMADGAPILHDELGTNATVHWSHGGGGDQSVFDSAPVVIHERYVQPRLIPNAIEPRGCLAMCIPSTDEFTLWSATQIPHIAKVTLAGTVRHLRAEAARDRARRGRRLRLQAERLRGGGHRARACRSGPGGPIKWIEERRENYVATTHGRGVIHDCTIAGTEDGRITGMKFVEIADLGAYYQLLTPGIPELGGWVYMGPYDPEAYWFEFTGVLTNCTPDRRVPRRRPPRGDVRGRAGGRRVRAAGGQGSGRGPAHEPARRRYADAHDLDHGAAGRLRRTTSRCWTGRWRWSATSSSARSSRRGATRAT